MSFLWDISFRIYKEISAAIHLFKQYSTVKQHSKVWLDYDRWFSDTCPCSESWNCVGTEIFFVSQFSLTLCLELNDLLKCMFPDSQIASKFSLSKTKCSYIINFGLASCFIEILLSQIKASSFFVISYDESLNKILWNEQMDCIIRFWINKTVVVCSRYFDSKFLYGQIPRTLLKSHWNQQSYWTFQNYCSSQWMVLMLVGMYWNWCPTSYQRTSHVLLLK